MVKLKVFLILNAFIMKNILLSFLSFLVLLSFNSFSQEIDDMYFTSKDRVKQKIVKKTISPADIILKNYRKNLSDYDASKDIDPAILSKYNSKTDNVRLGVTLKSLKYNRDNLYIKSDNRNNSKFFNSMAYTPYLYNYRIFDPFSYERINSLSSRRMLMRALSSNPMFAIYFFSDPFYSSFFPHLSPIDFWGRPSLSYYGMGRCFSGCSYDYNGYYSGYGYNNFFGSNYNSTTTTYYSGKSNPPSVKDSDGTTLRGPRSGRGEAHMNGENIGLSKIHKRGIDVDNAGGGGNSPRGITQNEYIRGRNNGNIESNVSRSGIRHSLSQDFNSRRSSYDRKGSNRISMMNQVNNYNSRFINSSGSYTISSDGRRNSYSRSGFQSSQSNRNQGGFGNYNGAPAASNSSFSRGGGNFSGGGSTFSGGGSSSGSGGAVSGGSSGGSSRGKGN